MPWYESRGARLHYRDEGDGPVVVLLHGVWMSSAFFRHQTTEGLGGARVIAPDFRGHGASEKPLDGHTVAGYAEDLGTLLDVLDLRDVTLVGWSMGAFVAWEHLRQDVAGRVTGLVVVDEAATDFAWPGWDHGVITVESLRELNAGLQTDQRGVAEHFAPAMFAAELPTTELAWIVDEMCRVPPAVASAVLLDQTLVDHRESLSELKVDTLVCFGRDAKLLSVAAGEDVAARIPGARLQVFEDSSHCPFLEEPAAFNAAVSAFASRKRTANA